VITEFPFLNTGQQRSIVGDVLQPDPGFGPAPTRQAIPRQHGHLGRREYELLLPLGQRRRQLGLQ